MPVTPREERIRVVADTHSNKLLVRANLLDMHELQKMVNIIDSDDPPNTKMVIKTHYVRLNLPMPPRWPRSSRKSTAKT